MTSAGAIILKWDEIILLIIRFLHNIILIQYTRYKIPKFNVQLSEMINGDSIIIIQYKRVYRSMCKYLVFFFYRFHYGRIK